MMKRYTRKEMGTIWSEEHKLKIWLEIEILACEALAELGVIPKDVIAPIREKASFSVERIDEIERTVNHDVIAFLTNVGEYVGAESRFIHLGMTSSDVLDTSLAVQIKDSGELLLNDLQTLSAILARWAKEFKHTIMVGRTHGIHAEPTTFGLKLALWYDETQRNIKRMKRALQAAMDVWQSKRNFKDVLKEDSTITSVLSESEINELFDLQKSMKKVNYIFQRVRLEE